MTEAITTGRRTWRLALTLALPWVVCGGLLWALVELTPTPQYGWVEEAASDSPRGLSAMFASDPDFFTPMHPVTLYAVWNERGIEWALQVAGVEGPPVSSAGRSERAGVIWTIGHGPGGRWSFVVVSLWWLLPFPLLSSGFNLWRWTRRGGD